MQPNKVAVDFAKHMGWLKPSYNADTAVYVGVDQSFHAEPNCGKATVPRNMHYLLSSVTPGLTACIKCWDQKFTGFARPDDAKAVEMLLKAHARMSSDEKFPWMDDENFIRHLGELRYNRLALLDFLKTRSDLSSEIYSETGRSIQVIEEILQHRSIPADVKRRLSAVKTYRRQSKAGKEMLSTLSRASKVWVVKQHTPYDMLKLGAADLTFQFPEVHKDEVVLRLSVAAALKTSVRDQNVLGVDQRCTPQELRFLLKSEVQNPQHFATLLTAWRATKT